MVSFCIYSSYLICDIVQISELRAVPDQAPGKVTSQTRSQADYEGLDVLLDTNKINMLF